jgi:hypothetical protein
MLQVLCVIDESESESVDGVIEDDSDSARRVTKTCYLISPYQFAPLAAWLGAAVVLNVILGVVSWWRCYANHFLHWGALATWMLLLVQGRRGE